MKKNIFLFAAFIILVQTAFAQTVQDSDIWSAIGDVFAYFNQSSLFAKIGYGLAFFVVLLNILPTSLKMPVTKAIDWLKQYDNYIANILRRLLELFNAVVIDRKKGGGSHA